MFFFSFNGTGPPAISKRRSCRSTFVSNNIRGELHCRKMGILDKLNELWPVPAPNICPCKYFDQGVDTNRTINRNDNKATTIILAALPEIQDEPMDCIANDMVENNKSMEQPKPGVASLPVDNHVEPMECDPIVNDIDPDNKKEIEPAPAGVDIMEVAEEPINSVAEILQGTMPTSSHNWPLQF